MTGRIVPERPAKWWWPLVYYWIVPGIYANRWKRTFGCSLCNRKWRRQASYISHRCVDTPEGRYWERRRRKA